MQRSDLCVNLGVTVWRGLPPVHRDNGTWRWVGTQGSLTLSFPWSRSQVHAGGYQ